MLTLDNERAAVAQAAVDFIERQRATPQAQSALPAATELPRSVAV
jgi:hypothetical protein